MTELRGLAFLMVIAALIAVAGYAVTMAEFRGLVFLMAMAALIALAGFLVERAL